MSTDGSTFDAVTSPFGQGELVDLYATEEGFLGVDAVYSQDGSSWQVWSSADGRTWKQIGTQLNLQSVRAIGTVGGEIVLVGRVGDSVSSTHAVLLSDDGGTSWKTVDLSFVLEAADPGRQSWIGAVDVNPAGLVLGVMSMLAVEGEEEPLPTSRVVMTTDFETWSEVPLADLGVGLDEVYVSGIASGGGRVMISATRFGFSGVGESQNHVLIGS